jgi:hypothetical protein
MKVPTKGEVIAALVAETRPALDRNGWAKDSCLPAARIGIDVLKGYDIHAQPMSVSVVGMNPTAANMKSPNDPIPDGAPDPAVIKIAYEGPTDPWSGHCVIVAGNEIVDLTIDQIDRPDRALTVPPMAFPAPNGFLEGKWIWLQREDGCKIGYRALQGDTAFKAAPDWSDDDKIANLRADIEDGVAKRVGPPNR